MRWQKSKTGRDERRRQDCLSILLDHRLVSSDIDRPDSLTYIADCYFMLTGKAYV